MSDPSPTNVLPTLRRHARAAAENPFSPFSNRPVGAALLLGDGRWVPGVRLESASYPLTVPALLGAFVTAVAGGRRDVRAAALSRPFYPGEAAWLEAALAADAAENSDNAPEASAAEVFADGLLVLGTDPLPAVGDRWAPFDALEVPESDEAGVRLARRAAERALVPESEFRVGCVYVGEDGRVALGCNVEFAEWTRGLCAERAAIAAAAAYGYAPAERLYLTCPTDPAGTPCGACRQLLAEQAAHTPLVMDRGTEAAEQTTPAALLPKFFDGRTLSL